MSTGVLELDHSDGTARVPDASRPESSDSSHLQSMGFDEQTLTQQPEPDIIEPNSITQSEEDLCSSIPGMYRILDLSSDCSTSGLVDKILVAQDTLQRFLNVMSPGAYMSLTKVDFEALEKVQVKFIGIYGHKGEIIRFLISIAFIDNTTAIKLTGSQEVRAGRPALRSGLYICCVPDSTGTTERMYIIYWPEDSTWDDHAPPSVCQNRLTFMRYLTKLCDQVTALISEGDVNSAFKVSQMGEPRRVFSVRRGFECASDQLVASRGDPGCNEDPELLYPRLVFGETRQGFMTTNYVPIRHSLKTLGSFKISASLLQDALMKERLEISESIGSKSLDYLIRLGLGKRFPGECSARAKAITAFQSGCQEDIGMQQKRVKAELNGARAEMEMSIRFAVVEAVFSNYPTLDRNRCFVSISTLTQDDESGLRGSYSKLISIYSRLAVNLAEEVCRADCKNIMEESFRKSKEKILRVLYLSRNLVFKTETQLTTLVHSVFNDNRQKFLSTLATIHHELTMPPESSSGPTAADRRIIRGMLKEGGREASFISDPDFIADLAGLSSTMPALRGAIVTAKNQAQQYLKGIVDRLCQTLFDSVHCTQLEDKQEQPKIAVDYLAGKDHRDTCRSLISRVNSLSQLCRSPHTLRIESVDVDDHREECPDSFVINGERETSEEARLSLTIHSMHLTKQEPELQLDATKIPKLRIEKSYSFELPVGFSVLHAQLLEDDILLLVLIDRSDNVHLCLEHLSGIEDAIGRQCGKILHRDELGGGFLLAFEESRVMLAVILCEKLELHVFVHDEGRGFTVSGSAIDLNPWYSEGTTIQKTCFASGSDELLLIDSQGIARILSLGTIQFRPASLNLHRLPIDVYSSPDGSYFLVVTSDGTSKRIVAYHWDTFGSTEGVTLPITDLAGNAKFAISSFGCRNAVHLLKLDLSAHTCSTVALDITQNITESKTAGKSDCDASSQHAHPTGRLSIVDCHVDVWTHFPVLTAVQRANTSSEICCPRSVLFVVDTDHAHYAARLSAMMDSFERTSKKPIGDKLKMLHVSGTTFDSFIADFSPNKKWENISLFRVREWVIQLLCLVPIHLAIFRDNLLIPSRDGMYCPDAERSLLGADVNHIIDSISLGWYEPIFKCYMPDKPVRVVSSLGEHYIGKSYTLNHLVDGSFAVSAMQDAEGVWMSVTPTEEELIVAFDFQYTGRSAWEDTFVLFSTAISNLVLFHTNFTAGHDISGLFESFQSSSTVLDSIADPSLFHSTLIIIIKDVVDLNKKTDIAREFSQQFQKIIEEKQDANFVSRLHGGKLNIMPWPSIESSGFYNPFALLKRRLDHQAVTHKTAREFLHVLKVLMAKIKANDRGTLSQTMTSYRLHRLQTLLPAVLAFGIQDVEHDMAELQNLDTNILMDSDTSARFIPNVKSTQVETREQALGALLVGWELFESRQIIPDAQWATQLSEYLEDLVDMRVDHVRAWVKSNLIYLQDDHASVEKVQQALEHAVLDLRDSVQLCRAQCASCKLLCIQNQSHEGAHDCKTTHACAWSCEYCSEAGESQPEGCEVIKCTMTAGHSGSHLCSVILHSCGAACKHLGKNGCLGRCVKAQDHGDDDHECGAVAHACEELCGLCHVRLADGSEHNCKGRCVSSVEIEHKDHYCGAQYCPIPCQLCGRLCSSHDHLHALEEDAVHLCGKPHICSQRCTVSGVCEVETTPESVETTFKGNECFQYTKYSQVAKRLKCVKSIPPGQLQHEGLHNHCLNQDAIHFCQARCPGCQYYCTFPMGHSQEHDTRHGSMSNVRWSIDGPNEVLETRERRLLTNDEGPPMACDNVCRAFGRHVHIDYCRAKKPDDCKANDEMQHITTKMNPEPDRPKDCLTHNWFWKRSGFKNPYSREQQEEFEKCDAMCAGPEHTAPEGGPAVPSFCILPLFHAPLGASSAIKQGYISSDGHRFTCRNPLAASGQQAFHIIFLIESSISMAKSDRTPLDHSAVSKKIRSRMNNRLGTVYGALHNFWTARQATCGLHRDANTVILHADDAQVVCESDSLKSPDELLDLLLPNSPNGGNSFNKAIKAADTAILKWWDNARPPVIILLSDGIASVSDSIVQTLFRKTAQKGKGLSLHAILFGPKMNSTRMERMITVALDAQTKTPKLTSASSSFHEAHDSVQLSNTFLGIAESLGKFGGH